MFLTILGTGFNLLYWLKFKCRSFQSFKIPPSGQHPPTHPTPSFELLKIGSFKFPAPQGPKLRLNSPLKCRIFWSVTPLPKEKMFKWREKGMVYGHLVVSIILTCSTMWNFIILLCLATECNTFEWIVFVLHLPHYSIAVHAYSADNNYLVKIAISALRLTELTI